MNGNLKTAQVRKNTKTKSKINFSLGNMQLNTNSIFDGVSNFKPIRYKALRSVNMSFGIFLKSLILKKNLLKLFIELVLEKIN